MGLSHRPASPLTSPLDSSHDLSHRVARGAVSTFGATLLGRVLAMAQSIAVARLLDPHRVGLFAIISYLTSLAGALCDLGIPVAVTKLTAEYRATQPRALLSVLRRLFQTVLGISLAVGAVIVVGADRLASFYSEPSLEGLFRLTALSLVLSVVGGFRAALLQGFQQIHLLAALGVANSGAMLVFTLLLTPWLGLPGIILASIATECLAWLWVGRSLARTIGRLADAPGHSGGVRVTADPLDRAALSGRVFHLAAPTLLNGMTLFGVAWFIRSWLAHAQGYEAVGFYQIADSVARALMLVSGAVAVPLMPAVAESEAIGSARVASGLETVLRLTLLVTLPAALFLALAGPSLITVVFGQAYAGAGPITAWLAVATVFQALAYVCWSAQVGVGRIWAGFKIAGAGQAVLALGTCVAAPTLGLWGVGLATLVAQMITFALSARDVTARLMVSLRGLGVLAPTAVCGFGLVAALVWSGGDGFVSAVLVAAGVVLWEALLLRPTERRLVREMAAWAASFGARRG